MSACEQATYRTVLQLTTILFGQRCHDKIVERTPRCSAFSVKSSRESNCSEVATHIREGHPSYSISGSDPHALFFQQQRGVGSLQAKSRRWLLAAAALLILDQGWQSQLDISCALRLTCRSPKKERSPVIGDSGSLPEDYYRRLSVQTPKKSPQVS